MNELFERLQGALGDAYLLERELGGGGMSRVFLATEQSLHRQVVIKLLAPELTSEVSTARFKREFELTAVLQHPHILPVLATGARDGLLYYIMPYIAGESLRHRMNREGQLPIEDAMRILSELSGALAYAHERGVVHRDIKPENVLLSDGHAVLADFGIAAALVAQRPTEGGERLTEVGTAMGTPGYMSPEQAAGETNLDARSDIYSLAVVGYEMLSGKPPFIGPTPLAVLTAHLSETPKPIETVRTDVPPSLGTALHRALAKNPDQRYQSAAEFGHALGISFTGPRGAFSLTARRRWLGVAAALVIIIAGAFAVWRTRQPAPGLDDNLIAIAPFEVLDPAQQVWREGLVDILSANLDGAGPLRTVSPAVVVRRWSGRPDRESAAELGRATGARLTVFGRMVPAGADSVRLTATIYDVGSTRPLGDIELRGATARMDLLADSLSLGILRELSQTRAIGAVRRSTIGSTSLPAIKAYLQGEQHYRRSDWDSAAFFYERAIALDSGFAPALRHLSNALGWKTSPTGQLQPDGYQYVFRAARWNRGLAPRESLLVVSDSLFATLITGAAKIPLRTRAPIAARLLATLDVAAQRFPDDPEVQFKLGDARYHFYFFFPSRENLGTARAAFDRSIVLDSAFAPAYIHTIDIATKQHDPEGARRYIRNYLALNPADVHATSMRLLDSLLDPARLRDVKLAEAVRATPPQAISTAFGSMMHVMDTAETAIRMAEALVEMGRSSGAPPGLERQAKGGLMAARAYRGHLRQAMADAEPNAWFLYGEAAMLGVLPPDSARRIFAGWAANSSENPGRAGQAIPFWATQRDTATILSLLARAERGELGDAPVDAIRAYLALARADTAEAIRRMSVPDSACLGWCAAVRIPLAMILSAKQRDREAAAILDQEFAQASPSRIMWMLTRGRVNERLGQKEKAIDSYSFVVSAWERADPELQPVVTEARAGLRRLATDAAR